MRRIVYVFVALNFINCKSRDNNKKGEQDVSVESEVSDEIDHESEVAGLTEEQLNSPEAAESAKATTGSQDPVSKDISPSSQGKVESANPSTTGLCIGYPVYISGAVKDAATQLPISGARIDASSKGSVRMSSTSSSTGKYKGVIVNNPIFPSFCNGTTQFTICSGATGYSGKCYRQIFSVPDNKIDFSLRKVDNDFAGACKNEIDLEFQTERGGCMSLRTGNIHSLASRAKMNYAAAVSYCENLVEGNESDWRLPATYNELKLLAGSERAGRVFKFFVNSSKYLYWTEESKKSNYRYAVDLKSGTAKSFKQTSLNYAVCVRN